MTEREKERKRLIEICEDLILSCKADLCADCEHNKIDYPHCMGVHFADHLLSNGVTVPPVTIGQTVWYLRGWCDGSFEIAEGKVSMLQQKADKSWKVRITVNSSVWDFTPNEIGTRYFLTKEEAEKALKEKQG